MSFNNNIALLRKNTKYGQLIYSDIYAMHERNEIVQSFNKNRKINIEIRNLDTFILTGKEIQHYYYKTQAINFLKLFKEIC